MLPMLGIYNVGCQNFVVDTSRLPRESETQELSFEFGTEEGSDSEESPRSSLCAMLDMHIEQALDSDKDKTNLSANNFGDQKKNSFERGHLSRVSGSSESFNCVEELVHSDQSNDNDKKSDNEHIRESEDKKELLKDELINVEKAITKETLKQRLSDGTTQTEASVLSDLRRR